MINRAIFRIFVMLVNVHTAFLWRDLKRVDRQVIHHNLIHNIAIYRQTSHCWILSFYNKLNNFFLDRDQISIFLTGFYA